MAGPLNPLVDPTPGTIINAVGAATISGATATLTPSPSPAIPTPLGRSTANSGLSLSNAYARLNAFVTSAQFWDGQVYTRSQQNTLQWRSFGNNGNLQEDSSLYKNYYNNSAAIPRAIRDNTSAAVKEINRLFNRPSNFTPAGQDPTPTLPQNLAFTKGFQNAKAFWRRFPPDWGFTFYTNRAAINSLQNKIQKQGYRLSGGPVDYDSVSSTIQDIQNNTGNISSGPAAWVGNQGLGEEWRYCIPFLRITNRWRNNTKFELPFLDHGGTNFRQNMFVGRNSFQPRGSNQWRGNYYGFFQFQKTRIPNDQPPANPSGNVNTTCPGIYSLPNGLNIVNYKGSSLTTQQHQAEVLTELLVERFTEIYGSFLTNQIQMRICAASPLYRNLSTDNSPNNIGRTRLIRPNQYLYNIAREYISSRYYWDPINNRFDLGYLTNP
jgi:hypothetical protein